MLLRDKQANQFGISILYTIYNFNLFHPLEQVLVL
jgi:hypothetical protein